MRDWLRSRLMYFLGYAAGRWLTIEQVTRILQWLK